MHDFLSLIPELAAHKTTATRLRPLPGAPTAAQSSVGGPLLWPADEPWPVCTGPHQPAMELRWHADVADERRLSDLRASRELTAEEAARLAGASNEAVVDFGPDHPVELIPVAQLRRADLPDFVGPDDADLAQVLWCPMDHPDQDYCPKVEVRYRHEGDVTPLPPREDTGLVSEDYVPRPCIVRPAQVTQYAHYKALPAELLAKIEDLDDEALDDYADFSTSRGFKVGGFPDWSMSDPEDMACEECATPMRLLLVADGWEDVDDEDRTPTGIQIGRGVNLNIWVCPTGLPHPTRTRMQH